MDMIRTRTGTVNIVYRNIGKKIRESDFYDDLTILFPNQENSTLKFLSKKIYNYISEIEINYDFMESYAKGDLLKILKRKDAASITEYIDRNININADERHVLYNMIQELILNRFDIIDLFKYAETIFPLWTNLKRLLLEKKPGIDKKYWEYIAEVCNKDEIFINGFKDVVNYKELNNFNVKEAIAAIVDYKTGSKKFENTITQKKRHKGWFPDGIFELSYQTNVEKNTLYRLAYAFELTFDKMEKLSKGSVKYCYNPFDYKDNLFRYGLENNYTFTKICEEIDKFNLKLKETDLSYDEAKEMIQKFFVNKSIGKDLDEFKELLTKIGTININDLRITYAKKYMNNIMNNIDLNKMKEYCELFEKNKKRYGNELLTILKKRYDKTLYEKEFKEKGGDKELSYAETQKLLIEKKMSIIRTDCCSTSNPNNEKLIRFLCDGKPKSTTYTSKSFTQWRINEILDGREVLEIDRAEVLRMGYITTLIDYINNKDTKYEESENLIKEFEMNTNRMLKECCFHPLCITLPLDATMYLAFSNTNWWIPNIYKVFHPQSS